MHLSISNFQMNTFIYLSYGILKNELVLVIVNFCFSQNHSQNFRMNGPMEMLQNDLENVTFLESWCFVYMIIFTFICIQSFRASRRELWWF